MQRVLGRCVCALTTAGVKPTWLHYATLQDYPCNPHPQLPFISYQTYVTRLSPNKEKLSLATPPPPRQGRHVRREEVAGEEAKGGSSLAEALSRLKTQ